MSKCKEEFEKRFGSLSVWPHLWEDWQACWNARGKVDAEICRTSGNPHQLQSIAESVWTLATAQHCAEAIEQENEK